MVSFCGFLHGIFPTVDPLVMTNIAKWKEPACYSWENSQFDWAIFKFAMSQVRRGYHQLVFHMNKHQWVGALGGMLHFNSSTGAEFTVCTVFYGEWPCVGCSW